MKRHPFFLLLSFVSLNLQPPDAAVAQTAPAPPPAASAQRSAADLENLAKPIALYPDPLIAIILPASAYPLEVVQAARLVKDTNNIQLIDQQPWDDNVKAVAKFPEVIAKMDADLSWTIALGNAFVQEPKALMDTIQELRLKAEKAGTLRTTPQQVVTVTNTVIEKTVEQQVVFVTNTVVQIEPADPQVIYVPSYPAYVYYPPPTYVYNPYAPLVTFGVGVAVGLIIANNCDWHHGCVWWGGGHYHGDVNINIDRNTTINRGERPANRPANRPNTPGARPTQQRWQPDQNRLRTSGSGTSPTTREARGWGSPGAQPVQRPPSSSIASRPAQPSYNFSQRPAASQQPARSPGTTYGQRPASGASGPRPTTTWQQPASRPAPAPSYNRPSPQPSAFSGVNSGSSVRNYSNRGAASRSGGGGFRGGGGRRR